MRSKALCALPEVRPQDTSYIFLFDHHQSTCSAHTLKKNSLAMPDERRSGEFSGCDEIMEGEAILATEEVLKKGAEMSQL